MRLWCAGTLAIILAAVGFASPAEARAPGIVGGQGVAITDLPWQALIFGNGKFCGGSIINEAWVLTAAHCMNGLSPSQVSVFTGISNYSQSRSTPASGVANIVVHPGYNPSGYANDIALIQLSAPISLGPNSRVIALPGGQDPATWPAANTEALISGWGTTTYEGSLSDQILRATVQVLAPPTAPCGQYSNRYFDGSMSVCAGLPGGGVDTCQGDSGGPLVVVVAGIPLLAGVTSDGIGCARAEYPGIYTRTTTYLPWIRGYVKIPTSPPVSPAMVTVTALAGERLLVSWTPSVTVDGSTVSSYIVNSVLPNAAEGPTCVTPLNTCVLEGAIAGEAYAVTVSATNPLGQGAPTAAIAPVVAVAGTSSAGRTVKLRTIQKWAGVSATAKARLRFLTPRNCTNAAGGVRMSRPGVCKVLVTAGSRRRTGVAVVGVLAR